MNIGVVGCGGMGTGLGQAWARAGHRVMFSHSRDPNKPAALAAEVPNASAGTVPEAVAFGDAVLLAVNYAGLKVVAEQIADRAAGKPVITCVSGLRPDFAGNTVGLATDLTVSVAEQVAGRLWGALVVEAFNVTFAEIIAGGTDGFGDHRPTVFLCGDDAAAKGVAAGLVADAGFEPVDAGRLKVARTLETLATAWVQFAVAANLFPEAGLRCLRRG